jgi:hypothetical protein
MNHLVVVRRAHMLNGAEMAKLRKAVAYYLYIQSKDEPDDKAGLYRAAALALIKKPVDAALLREAEKRKSDDYPLCGNDYYVEPELEDLWDKHHSRTPI